MRTYKNRKFDKESLYEQLMTTISKQVKNALNEDELEDFDECNDVDDLNDTMLTEEDEEDLSVEDVELENNDSEEDVITNAGQSDVDDENETEEQEEEIPNEILNEKLEVIMSKLEQLNIDLN